MHDIQSAQISQKQDGQNTYAIMETMCSPGYHHNGFLATQVLRNMMYVYILLVPMNQKSAQQAKIYDSRHTESLNLTEAR